MIRNALTAVVATGLIGALVTAEATAQNYFGAIAYSTGTGGHGYSYDYNSRGGAEQRALNECASHGGGCQVATWFRNACGALAVGPDGWGADWGNSSDEAQAKAMAKCGQYSYSCSIVRWVCTK